MNSSSCDAVRHVLLTGPPGIGKTTLIQKVCQELKTLNILFQGFYTTELRENGRRTGFDIVSFDGSRGPLARVGNGPGPRVGQYNVHVQAFELVALPVLQSQVIPQIVVIDEVGKMELFSKNFEQTVKKLFFSSGMILGTLPLQKGKPLELVEFLRTHPFVKLISVNINNRDELVPELVQIVLNILSKNEKPGKE